jgi:hypothetical protein
MQACKVNSLSVRLFVCVSSPNKFWNEIWQAGDAIEGDLDATLFSLVASTI